MGSQHLRGEEAVQVGIRAVVKFFEKDGHRRPYSGTQLWENTKKPISKALFQQALTDLVNQGRLSTKAMGKICIYFPVQPDLDPVTTEEMIHILDHELPTLEANYSKLLREAVKLEKANQVLLAEPTNLELEAAASQQDEFKQDSARFSVLSQTLFVEPERLQEAKLQHDRHLRRWLTLRAVARRVLGQYEDRLTEATGLSIDVAHLAGVLDDNELPESVLQVPPLLLHENNGRKVKSHSSFSERVN